MDFETETKLNRIVARAAEDRARARREVIDAHLMGEISDREARRALAEIGGGR